MRFRQVTNLSQSLNNVEDPLELPAKLDTLALDSPALGHMIIPTFDEPRNAHDYLIALYRPVSTTRLRSRMKMLWTF